jgi:hypothetical protein
MPESTPYSLSTNRAMPDGIPGTGSHLKCDYSASQSVYVFLQYRRAQFFERERARSLTLIEDGLCRNKHAL